MAEILLTHDRRLSPELVDHIKLFTGEGCWQNGRYVNIRKISRTDPRYAMLSKRPRIRQLPSNFDRHLDPLRGSVWFKLATGKFFVINVIFTKHRIGDINYEGIYRETYYDTKTQIELIR